MIKPGPAFTRPRTPAAKCLHLVRLNPIITRSELVEATGLSQPTITRATTALLQAGLIQERTDLTRTKGRGRPTVPLEVAENNWLLAGIAIGTSSTYIGLYDTKGRTIREDDITTPVASLSEADFIEHIMAGINRLTAGLDQALVSVGVTTSGQVDGEGLVYAPNLGWNGVDIAERLRFQFSVPVVVTAAIPAILGSETQAADIASEDKVLVLFADDSIGAALSNDDGVQQLTPLTDPQGQPAQNSLSTAAVLKKAAEQGVTVDSIADAPRSILDKRAHDLGVVAARLVREHHPNTVVVAGSAFVDDPQAPRRFASAVREEAPDAEVQLRMIPTHREIVRAVARAVALDPLLRVPLELRKVRV